MPDWVLAAERAYVAAVVGPQPLAAERTHVAAAVGPQSVAAAGTADLGCAPGSPSVLPSAQPTGAATPDPRAHAIAAAGATASRFLAVSAPRSFGIVIDDVAQVDAAALSLVAHRTWFAPRDIRCASSGSGASELAAATVGRIVSVDEALASDIVNLHSVCIGTTSCSAPCPQSSPHMIARPPMPRLSSGSRA